MENTENTKTETIKEMVENATRSQTPRRDACVSDVLKIYRELREGIGDDDVNAHMQLSVAVELYKYHTPQELGVGRRG